MSYKERSAWTVSSTIAISSYKHLQSSQYQFHQFVEEQIEFHWSFLLESLISIQMQRQISKETQIVTSRLSSMVLKGWKINGRVYQL